jgi:hypothetical protein
MEAARVPRVIDLPPKPEERREQASVYVLTRAETSECTCPDSCERDHGND